MLGKTKYQTATIVNYPAYLSTSHSQISLPESIYNDIIRYILNGKEQPSAVDQYLLSSCDAKAYPSFYLRIDKYWFEISPSTYIINATYHKDGVDQYKDYCTLALTKLS